MEAKPVVPAMESPKHLFAWFKAKGYQNLTLRIGDVMQLPERHIRTLDTVATRMDLGGSAEGRFAALSPSKRLQTCFPMGYLLISIDALFAQPWADMRILTDLQEATICYREIRRGLGYPTRTDECKCGGNKKCRACGGAGYTRTILEMSPEEQRLAHGG